MHPGRQFETAAADPGQFPSRRTPERTQDTQKIDALKQIRFTGAVRTGEHDLLAGKVKLAAFAVPKVGEIQLFQQKHGRAALIFCESA